MEHVRKPSGSPTGCSGAPGSTAGFANHRVVLAGLEYWIDIAFVERQLALEIDGWAWHCDVDRFAHDRRRQNALILAGVT